MKLKVTFSLVVVLITFQTVLGQNAKAVFGTRNEVYFSFQVQSKNEISSITRLISVDNVKNNTVWAYANMKQFLKFSQLGYNITLLPHPGDDPGVVMRDNIVLNTSTTWNFYPTYSGYEDLMNQFQTLYPNICKIQTIATLASGRKLLSAKISDNVATDEAEPEFLYTSSIHGDETTGYILMLHLIDYLLSNYGTNTEVTDLINNMEIYITPLANPDGTYAGGNSTVNGATRGNVNGVDMNRNYPDPKVGQHPDGNAWQAETVAFMDFATQHHFVAAANFHGGSEVVNYPWDTWATLSADDNWWQFVSNEYADTAQLHASALGNTTYLTSVSSTGVTNGYAWYEVNGGRQDYMNYWQHCREVTIEISNTKLLPAAQLLTLWEYNWRSLILYMKEARYGIQGIITDQVTGLPVAAKVFIASHDVSGSEVYSSATLGDYHRLLKGGTYSLTISATGYQTKTISGVVVADHSTTSLDIQLTPLMLNAQTLAATLITGTSALLNGTVNPFGLATTYHFEWGTTNIYGNSTTTTSAGSGTSTISVSAGISGLNQGVLYHYRIVATNSSGTVYADDMTFITSCGTIASFPWNEGFENAGVIPNCWTQERVSSSGIDWTFITGSGNTHPTSAHGGTYNACLKDASATDNKTKLITPPLNISSLGSPVLKFWHTQAVWGSDQDKLIVYYRTSATGAWTTLTTYTANITTWTQETINLPGASSEYYVAFEGNAKYGYGVCVDDVSITGTSTTPTLTVTPANQSVTPAAGTTSFAVTSNSAWIASSNQTWCTVTTSGTGNGTITANYTVNNTASLRVANVTVTVAGLTPIVVTVTQAAPTLSVAPSDQAVPSTSGNTSFTVTSNTNWTVSSSQTWCTVTLSGSGSGAITATYSENLTYSPRVANVTVNVAGLSPVVVTVTQAGAPPPEFNYTIANDVQTSDKTLEFDLYLLDTQPLIPLELSIIQAGILVNSGIIGSGAITTTIVSGYSELVSAQQPITANWATGTPNGCIKITPRPGPGCGNGTIISTNGLGTKICRVRIANSVPFTAGSQANLAFSFTTSPYPTKVFQYSGTPCISTTMTTSSTNCFSLATNPVLNGPPSLSVSPSDRSVTSPVGTTPFVVTSNAGWTAISNQLWCTVTPSGFANGTITAGYTENTDPLPRIANITVTVAGLSPVLVTVTQAGASIRTFNLTLFLEGLYAGNSTMHPAMDESSYHWGETIADKLTVELHAGSNYSNIVYTATNVSLNTNGAASFTLPSYYNGNYYVTVRQRNHILTATAFPVSFSTSTINYNFDLTGKAFGNNLGMMVDGKYVFYAGDVNQDGIIDGTDLSSIDNLSSLAASGYLPEDVNGDGLIDGSDLSVAGNNADVAIGVITP